MLKKTAYWIFLLLPTAYLVFFAGAFAGSIYTLKSVKNTDAGKDISALEYFALRQFIRPAYLRSRNIYQAFRDCVELDTELIYKPRHNNVCRFQNLEFSTTLLHLNGIRWYEQKESRESGVRKILVVGDSHAMGWGVEGEQTFSALLESGIENLRVDNMAVSSYGLPRELMLMKAVLAREDYDLVLVQYCDNDLREVEHYVENDGVFYHYAIPAQSPRSKEELINNFFVRLASRIARFPVDGLEGRRTQDVARPAEKVARVFSDFLDASVTPEMIVFTVNNVREFSTQGEFEYLKNAVAQLRPALSGKIQVLDPLSQLSAEDRKTHYYQIDGHLNALGHRFLAEALRPIIEKALRQ